MDLFNQRLVEIVGNVKTSMKEKKNSPIKMDFFVYNPENDLHFLSKLKFEYKNIKSYISPTQKFTEKLYKKVTSAIFKNPKKGKHDDEFWKNLELIRDAEKEVYGKTRFILCVSSNLKNVNLDYGTSYTGNSPKITKTPSKIVSYLEFELIGVDGDTLSVQPPQSLMLREKFFETGRPFMIEIKKIVSRFYDDGFTYDSHTHLNYHFAKQLFCYLVRLFDMYIPKSFSDDELEVNHPYYLESIIFPKDYKNTLAMNDYLLHDEEESLSDTYSQQIEKSNLYLSNYADTYGISLENHAVIPMTESPAVETAFSGMIHLYGIDFAALIKEQSLRNNMVGTTSADLLITGTTVYFDSVFFKPFMIHQMNKIIKKTPLGIIKNSDGSTCESDFVIVLNDGYDEGYEVEGLEENPYLLDFYRAVKKDRGSTTSNGDVKEQYFTRRELVSDYVISIYDTKKERIAAIGTFTFDYIGINTPKEDHKFVNYVLENKTKEKIDTGTTYVTTQTKVLHLEHLYTLGSYEYTTLKAFIEVPENDYKHGGTEKVGMGTLVTYTILQIAEQLQSSFSVIGAITQPAANGTRFIIEKFGMLPATLSREPTVETYINEAGKPAQRTIFVHFPQVETFKKITDLEQEEETQMKNIETKCDEKIRINASSPELLLQAYEEKNQYMTTLSQFYRKKNEYFQKSRTLFESILYVQNQQEVNFNEKRDDKRRSVDNELFYPDVLQESIEEIVQILRDVQTLHNEILISLTTTQPHDPYNELIKHYTQIYYCLSCFKNFEVYDIGLFHFESTMFKFRRESNRIRNALGRCQVFYQQKTEPPVQNGGRPKRQRDEESTVESFEDEEERKAKLARMKAKMV